MEDYRTHIKSSHIQDLIKLMVDIKKKEDLEQDASQDEDNMRMLNDHFKTSEIYGDKVAILKTSSV